MSKTSCLRRIGHDRDFFQGRECGRSKYALNREGNRAGENPAVPNPSRSEAATTETKPIIYVFRATTFTSAFTI